MTALASGFAIAGTTLGPGGGAVTVAGTPIVPRSFGITRPLVHRLSICLLLHHLSLLWEETAMTALPSRIRYCWNNT